MSVVRYLSRKRKAEEVNRTCWTGEWRAQAANVRWFINQQTHYSFLKTKKLQPPVTFEKIEKVQRGISLHCSTVNTVVVIRVSSTHI